MTSVFNRLAIIGTAAILSACSTAPLSHSPDVIRQHVIAVDGKGRPHDPMQSTGPEYSMTEYRNQIASIFKAMDAFHKTHPDHKILIFVHGGLNSPADSLASADSEMDHVMAAGYYPIYLNWNSDLLSTYGEHIGSITQGQTNNTFARTLLAPVYVVADIGRAATRIPIVWINQIGSDIQGAASDITALPRGSDAGTATQPTKPAPKQRWASGPHGQAIAQTYEQLRAAQTADKQNITRQQLRIYIGPDLDVNSWHMARLAAAYVVTFPVKLLSQPVIDWLGTPAWQVMLRRTLMAFDGELGGNPSNPDLDPTVVGRREGRGSQAIDFSTTGAVEVFREQLLRITANHHDRISGATSAPSNQYDVTLVGHSMGTMVLNEWLRRDLLESTHQFYSHIVYMAAACSVRDFGRAVVPYLLQHDQTQFYNLMLHPLADLRERRRGWDLPPRGSLLVWLDDFLTDPQTPLDRTLGRWDNIIPATEVIPQKVRGQVTLKAFALAPYNEPIPPAGQPDFGPQEHGQFRGRPYWCKGFWTDEEPIVPGPNCLPAVPVQ